MDSNEMKLEAMLRDVAEEIIVSGERHYRQSKEHHYQWLLKRKHDLEEKERQRIETEARLERERIEKARQARIQRLLDEASAHNQACNIREYVEKVLTSVKTSSSGYTQEQLLLWAEWARTQADDLDPIVSGRFQVDELPD